MDLVARARVFKRSWVEMAEGLSQVRSERLFEAWGYESVHTYALEELHIKKTTVDKLTNSFTAIESYAPQVLQWDGVAQQVPSYEAVDYFAKAVGVNAHGEEIPDRPEELVEEMKQAVFEDRLAPGALKRRFAPVLYPKSDDEEKVALLRKVRASARRLEGLLQDIEGLAEERVEEVTEALESLRGDLDALEGES